MIEPPQYFVEQNLIFMYYFNNFNATRFTQCNVNYLLCRLQDKFDLQIF